MSLQLFRIDAKRNCRHITDCYGFVSSGAAGRSVSLAAAGGRETPRQTANRPGFHRQRRFLTNRQARLPYLLQFLASHSAATLARQAACASGRAGIDFFGTLSSVAIATPPNNTKAEMIKSLIVVSMDHEKWDLSPIAVVSAAVRSSSAAASVLV